MIVKLFVRVSTEVAEERTENALATPSSHNLTVTEASSCCRQQKRLYVMVLEGSFLVSTHLMNSTFPMRFRCACVLVLKKNDVSACFSEKERTSSLIAVSCFGEKG